MTGPPLGVGGEEAFVSRSVSARRARLLPAGLAVAVLALLSAHGAGAAAKKPTRAKPKPAAMAFENYPLPTSILDAKYSGEPSVGINWTTGNVLFQANASTIRASFNDASAPPTVTWKDVSSPYTPLNLDPILATDPTSGLTLAGGDAGACGSLALTRDDGDTWSPVLPCSGAIDHPTVGYGPPVAESGLGVGTRIGYYCQQYPLVNECSRSLDGGQTWSPAVPVQYCLGLFGHVKTGRNGVAYLPSKDCYANGAFAGSAGVGGAVSADNGLSWRSYAIPNAGGSSGFDPSVAVAADGSAYEAWVDESYRLRVARSTDTAATWSSPADVTKGTSIAVSTFPAVVAGDGDRVALAYLGSTVPVGKDDPFGSGYHGLWHLYVSVSYDAGRTWATQQVSKDPVQRGWIDNGGTTASDHRNLLDFIDAGLTKTGRVVVAYADGCVSACAEPEGTEPQSSASLGVIARQWQGKGLYAEFDKVAG